jgi:hypothetical protein
VRTAYFLPFFNQHLTFFNFFTMKKMYTLFVFLVVTQVAFAVTRRVNNNSGYVAAPPLLYTDLTAAYNDAADNDVIIVEPSPTAYTLPTNIDKKLTIIGNGMYNFAHTPALQTNSNNSHIRAANQHIIFGPLSAGSVISGIVFSSNGYNVYANANNLDFSRCYFDISSFNSFVAMTGLSLKSCFFENGAHVQFDDASAQSGIISNCAFKYDGIRLSAADAFVIENCDLGWTAGGVLDLGDNASALANAVVTNCIIGDIPTNYSNSMFTNCIFKQFNFTGQGNFYMPTTFENLFQAYSSNNDNAFLLAVANNFSYTSSAGALTNQPNPAIDTGVFGSGDDRGCYNDGTNRPTWKPAGIPAVPSIYSLLGGGTVSGNTVSITISTRGNN